MRQQFSLFVATLTTLVAIINPLEVLPVYLMMLSGKDDATHRSVARRACFYALLLCFFFLVFGALLLRLFDVSLSMVRIAGGLILVKVGFELFSPPSSGGIAAPATGKDGTDIAFVPLAMPLMFGPGAIATILGMTGTIKKSSDELASFMTIAAAIIATMLVTFLCLANATKLVRALGPLGINAVTRIVGFFVAAMGIGLAFDGIIEALVSHGLSSMH